MPQQKQVYVGSYSLPVGVTESKPGKFSISRKPGGLAIGVEGAFTETGAFKKEHWMGIRETPKKGAKKLNKELTTKHHASYLLIKPEEKRKFYSESSNGVFWPLTHGMPEKVGPEASFKIHEDVSKRYAKKLDLKIQSDLKKSGGKTEDVQVWLHDYHVASVPKYLKERNPKLNVSFFHHETWPEHKPEPETLKQAGRKLGERSNPIRNGTGSSYSPEGGAMKRQDEIRFREMVGNLLHADSIGFHTQMDADNFVKTVANFQLIPDPEEFEKMKQKLFVDPIGIPKEKIEKEFKASLTELTNPSDDLLEKIEKWKEDVIPLAQETDRPTLFEVADRLSRGEGTLHDLQSLELSLAAHERIEKKEETLFDEEYLKSGQHFDPAKIQIGSVQRFDYTKGVHEQLDAFHAILKDKSDNGVDHPEKEVQLNLVCSSARDIPAYAAYEEAAMAKIREINSEFPGAVNYIPGIPNEKLPVFNASNDISSATSTMDGYILSVGEAQLARTLALDNGVITPEKQASGTVVSNKAGISESLGGKERQSKNEALAIVEPTAEGIKKGFEDQLGRIEEARKSKVTKRDDSFMKIPDLLTDTKDFGTKALTFASEVNGKGLDNLRHSAIQQSKTSLKRKATPNVGEGSKTKTVKLK